VDPAGRGLVRELGHGRHDPAPSSRSIVVTGERQFVSATSTLLKCVVAIALEHELRRPPNVDLGYQSGRLMKSRPGPPMTLGKAAAADVRLIVWCKDCDRQVEPDPAEMVARYGEGHVSARLARSACLLRVRWSASGHGRHRNRAAIASNVAARDIVAQSHA